MSELSRVSPGLRATIRDHLKRIYLEWVHNGRFYTALRDKTKNGARKLHPNHVKEVLLNIYYKAKSGIVAFVKKLLSAPMNFVKLIVAFMIGELVENKELQHRLVARFTQKRVR